MTITIPPRAKMEPVAFPDNLPIEDGEPLESNWHRIQINLLVDLTQQLWHDRTDFFAGGNMFIYYSARQALSRDYRGPDFFVVKDVEPKNERQVWKTWEEDGRFPDVIVELLSPSTAETDLTTKRQLYERTFRTPEYFAYDPDTKELRGWRLRERQYQEIVPDARGWFWSEELGVWLGLWEGEYERVNATWLRYYDQHGALLPTGQEAERNRAAQEAARAAQEAARAAQEAARAAQEALAREAAEARARELEAEIARLRAEIARGSV